MKPNAWNVAYHTLSQLREFAPCSWKTLKGELLLNCPDVEFDNVVEALSDAITALTQRGLVIHHGEFDAYSATERGLAGDLYELVDSLFESLLRSDHR